MVDRMWVARRVGVGAVFTLLGLAGCPEAQSPPPPAPTTAAPVAAPTAAPTGVASTPPAPVPPPAPVGTAPTLPTLEDAERSPLPDSLAEVKKAFDEKFYSQAADLLEAEAKKRGAGVEHEVLVFALLGHARHMTNEIPLAVSNYRRVLAKWGPFYNAGRKLSTGTPEEQKRYQLGLEAFGEALFFLAEQKRLKQDEVVAPSFDQEDTPAMVKVFVDGKLAGHLARSSKVINTAKKEFDKVLALKPEPPQRWVVATHSRLGAMYATVVESVREQNVSKPNRGPLDEKAAPYLANAKESYQACVKAAAGAEATIFSKSCEAWLKANP